MWFFINSFYDSLQIRTYLVILIYSCSMHAKQYVRKSFSPGRYNPLQVSRISCGHRVLPSWAWAQHDTECSGECRISNTPLFATQYEVNLLFLLPLHLSLSYLNALLSWFLVKLSQVYMK